MNETLKQGWLQMEHTVVLSTQQVEYLLDVLNTQGELTDDEVEDFGVQDVLEDAVEESWFEEGGCIHNICKEMGTLG
jgi:polyhydroxyalkanoate synthesis regulator phasin